MGPRRARRLGRRCSTRQNESRSLAHNRSEQQYCARQGLCRWIQHRQHPWASETACRGWTIRRAGFFRQVQSGLRAAFETGLTRQEDPDISRARWRSVSPGLAAIGSRETPELAGTEPRRSPDRRLARTRGRTYKLTWAAISRSGSGGDAVPAPLRPENGECNITYLIGR